LRKSLSIKNERCFELLIQQYQEEIIRLLDFVIVEREKLQPSYHVLNTALLSDLQTLLAHIERRYAKYFNVDGKVPIVYLDLAKAKLKNRIKGLKRSYLLAFKDDELTVSLFQLLEDVVRLKKEMAYRQLIFVKDMIYELGRVALGNDLMINKKMLLEVLIYQNLNSKKIVEPLIQSIIKDINAIRENSAKLDYLNVYLKEINQVISKPGAAFNRDKCSLQEWLTVWISQEVAYLEGGLRLFSVMPRQKEDAPIADDEKLHLSVSVDILALIVRGAKDSKLILNEQFTTVFKTVSRFCSTKKVQSPSPHSMQKKSYVAERNVRQAALDVLHDIIKHVHKY
jgi:hypothetical protein